MLEIIKDKIEDIISILENTGYYLINQQEKHEYKTFAKEDGSMLTELDIASELLIKNELKSLFGEIKVLSEENSKLENEQIAKEKFCFLLDPIDGTAYFNKGKDFTINLAFCVDKKPIISFIHSPKQKTIIFGDSNKSFKRANGKTTPLIKISQKTKYSAIDKKSRLLKIAIGVHNFANKAFTSKLILDIQKCGYNFSPYGLTAFSAMEKLFSFANNEIDAFWSTKLCKDWDVLPALPIVNSMNACYYTKNPILFNNNNFDSGDFIVARNEELLKDLVKIMENIENEVVK